MFDFSGTMLDDLALPTELNLTANSWNTFSVTFLNDLTDDQYRFTGDLDKFAMNSVGVAGPATAIVFASALFGLISVRRRKS